MSIFKCKMCGGDLIIEQGSTVAECEYCGSKQTLPKLDDDRRANLYDRANHFRRNNEFDKAAGIYEQILNEDTTDAEAYWSLVLCRYGIEYVEDPATRKRVPTVNRAQFTSIFDDDNYRSALQYADGYQRSIYEAEANAINEIQKGILAISQKEEPFDVFICYKETDANGRRTVDSVLANDLYHQLTQEGFKVFFSRITLEDKLGTAYEPYIFAALNSAKVMVALGTKPEYFKAPWVKNEWSRYLARVKQSGGKKVLIPAYRDMDPYDLPEEFSHLQAQDMSKLGFMQDLIRGIKKIAKADEPKAASRETVVVNSGNANADPLLRRAFMFLEDGEWAKADDFCEQVLNLDPENAQAYLGKLMAELHVRRQEDLTNCEQPFDRSNNFKKAVRFGDKALKDELNGCITHINERNENARLTGIYNRASEAMNAANTESAYKAAAGTFKSISGFQDADALAERCLDKAEVCRKDAIYSSARTEQKKNSIDGCESAIRLYESISGWKDADEQIYVCQRKIEEIKAKEEADRLERERQAEQKRIAAEKAAKKRKKIAAIVAPIAVACIAFIIVLTTVLIPNGKYNSALDLYNAGKYDEAITAFKALNGYRDSEDQIINCETASIDSKYNTALELYNAGKYDEAITAFKALNGYRDSEDQIINCETASIDSKYNTALELYNAGKYDEAITAFKALNGYRDSEDQIINCETAIKYNAALELYNAGKYDEAITAFKALNGYRDSEDQIINCETAIKDPKYNAALELYNAGKYDEAITVFKALDGYKDSDTQLEKCYIGKYGEENYNLIKNIKVGDIYRFGSYEQNNKTSDGKEEIEWIVLEKDGMSLLLISKYALDCQPYNTSDKSITWETCSLRKWLNGTFLNAAFSSEERRSIISSTVTADKNPHFNTFVGKNTTDKVFLLSIKEADKYFSSDEARKCAPTEYAKAQGAHTDASTGNCFWLLRTPGINSDRAAYVDYAGGVSSLGCGVDLDDRAVRPALWINLGS